jgi:hypothetical protein
MCKLTAEILQSIDTNKELSTSVDVEDLVPKFLGDFLRLGKGFHAGVVDDDVEFSEVLDGLLEKRSDLSWLGDVTLNSNSLAAILLDLSDGGHGWLGRFGVVDADGSTSLSERFCHDGTKASAGTGDKGNLTIEADVCSCSHCGGDEGLGSGGKIECGSS